MSDEVVIHIDGSRFRFWTQATIEISMTEFSKAYFSAPFEVENREFRQTFAQFQFKPVDIFVDGDKIFTGVILNIDPVLDAGAVVNVSCYSICGFINDCTAPVSIFPLQVDSQNLRQTAEKILAPFGLEVESPELSPQEEVTFFEEELQPFERTSLKTDQKIIDYIVELAKQRNLLTTDTANGDIKFFRPENSSPVALLEQGSSPLISVTPSFNSQDYFSEVTAIEPVSFGLSGGSYTVNNTKLSKLRPLNFIAGDAEGADTKAAAEAKMGRMLGNAVSYVVTVSTWRDSSGSLWKEGSVIKLLAPLAMIYTSYDFMVRKVSLLSGDEKTAELEIVLPEAFTGKIPERMPWDE